MRKRTAGVLAIGWLVVILTAATIPIPLIVDLGGGWLLGHDVVIHGLLFLGFAWTMLPALRAPLARRIAVTVAAGLVLGGGIELVQELLPWERGAKLSDFVGDAVGLLAGSATYALAAAGLRRRGRR